VKAALSVFVLGFALTAGARGQVAVEPTSCTTCHGSEEWFGEEGAELLADHAASVHASVGLSCHDCHGGNPDPALGEDTDAMDESFEGNPYRGAPERSETAAFCGRCHSDPIFMRTFLPAPRVDQEREYYTSQHGIAMREGRENAATCTDCHGLHGIRPIGSPESSVYPSRVAETCRTCHESPEVMAGVVLADGSPLPLDQFARWSRSSHANALLVREDLSAPTCNDCHGNHGAAPPGVGSVTFVCGQCHGREAELFRSSPKSAGFQDHREYLADAGELGCAACHEEPEPQAAFHRANPFTECTSCHNSHAIVRPTLASLEPLPEVPCAFCHEAREESGSRVVERSFRRYEATRDRLVAAARAQGLEGEELYNRLVDEALALPEHTMEASAPGERGPRAEFGNLFSKFRIGKTTFEYEDPATGESVTASVVRCGNCHAREPLLADAPKGLTASAHYVEQVVRLTTTAAQAERSLLRARRGGVATGTALTDLQQAVDAQIQQQVLFHSFDYDSEAFTKVQEEGQASAERALAGALQALAELGYRRAGLGISLIVVLLVLLGLAFKIREISRRDALRYSTVEAERLQQIQRDREE
jgi:hypothetical protein